MNKKAVIVGSAPIAQKLSDRNLQAFHKIALNKSWRLRNDFNDHVFLSSLKRKDMPTPAYPASSISKAQFARCVTKAGGPYLCSMTVATSAGYWAAANCPQRIFSYYGCDMVYPKDDNGENSHFYGSGDKGPMLGKFVFNDNFKQKFARLFVFGLQHRVLFLNGSGEEGTQLSLPIVPLGDETADLADRVLSLNVTQDILRAGTEAFIAEQELRTPAFDERVLLFNENTEAHKALSAMTAAWDPVVGLMDRLQKKITQIVSVAAKEKPAA